MQERQLALKPVSCGMALTWLNRKRFSHAVAHMLQT